MILRLLLIALSLLLIAIVRFRLFLEATSLFESVIYRFGARLANSYYSCSFSDAFSLHNELDELFPLLVVNTRIQFLALRLGFRGRISISRMRFAFWCVRLIMLHGVQASSYLVIVYKWIIILLKVAPSVLLYSQILL